MQHAIKFTLCKIPIDSNIDNDSNVAENFDNFNHNIWLLFWGFFFGGGGGGRVGTVYPRAVLSFCWYPNFPRS